MKIVKMKILFKVGDLLSAKESIPTIQGLLLSTTLHILAIMPVTL